MKKISLSFIATLFLSPCVFASSAVGIWWSPKHESKIEIYEKDKRLFGKIIWLPAEKAADKDKKNPKEDLRSRDILGLEFMSGFVKKGDNFWGSGQIYDPKTGNTYDCKMNLTDPDTLEVRGFIGISLFGRTETFERVKEDATALVPTDSASGSSSGSASGSGSSGASMGSGSSGSNSPSEESKPINPGSDSK